MRDSSTARFLTIAAVDDASGRDQTGRVGAEKIEFPRAVGPLQPQVDSIEAVPFGTGIARLRVEVCVVDLDIEVEVSLGGTRLRARAIACGRGQGRRIRLHAPIVAVAVQQRLYAQRIDVQIPRFAANA